MMMRLQRFFTQPFTEKGIFWGIIDALVKLVALIIWADLTWIMCGVMHQSILLDYNPVTQLWWFSYCFLIFFGASWLAYIAIFVRDYNEEGTTEE